MSNELLRSRKSVHFGFVIFYDLDTHPKKERVTLYLIHGVKECSQLDAMLKTELCEVMRVAIVRLAIEDFISEQSLRLPQSSAVPDGSPND